MLALACGEDPETYVGSRPTPVENVASSERSPEPGPDASNGTTLTWTGCGISRTAYMTEAAAAYKLHSGVRIIVTGGGATRGIRATAGGISDIGGSCRHCLPESQDQEVGAVLTHVGWDALVFFTHKSNTVEGISYDEAKAILKGTASNWQKLGGPDKRIVRAFRRQTKQGKLSGVGHMTRLMLFDDANVDYTKDALFELSSGPIERFVERTPYSFAVTGVSSAQKRAVTILKLDGIFPDKNTIASGKYRLFRPLYLVTRGRPAGAVKEFIDWILGAEGQAVLSAAETVNLEEGAKLGPLFQYWPRDPDLVWNRSR